MMTDNVSSRIEASFRHIEKERMQDVPLLNSALRVQAVGFDDWRGRKLGVIITPWMMSILMLPGPGDEWDGMPLGQVQSHSFPQKECNFKVNEFDGLGVCQTCSLHSPMFDFKSQQAAEQKAGHILACLLREPEPHVAEGSAKTVSRRELLRGGA